MKALKCVGKRGFAVALSLVLCAGMVVPAFAAVEFNKDAHVDAGTGALRENDEGNYDYYLGGDVTLDKTLVIGAGVGASIDLNGHALIGGDKGSVVKVTGQDASLILDDTSESGGGKITGGTGEDKSGKTYGGGAYVGDGGSLTINGGEISGNEATYGGGVYLHNGSTLVVNGGSISENEATGYVTSQGGGVYSAVSPMKQENNITIKDGSISNNTATWSGGGICASNTKIVITGGDVSDNTATKANGGGISFISGTAVIAGGKISGNTAGGNGGGIDVGSDGSLIATGGVISNNTAGKNGGGIYATGSSGIQNDKPAYWYAKVNLQGLEASGSHIYGNTAKTGADIKTGRLGYVWLKETDNWISETTDLAIENTDIKPNASLKSDYVPHKHTPGEPVRENEVPATCTAEGSYDEVVYCSECREELSRTPKTIDKLDHTPGEAERENEVAADYGVAGSYDEVVKCTVCGEELSRETMEIPALVRPVTPPATTPDVPADPGVTEIEEEEVPLAGLPLELAAEEPLTRGQLIAILHWMDSEPAAELSSFLDVAADHDFALAIGWAQENGIAKGVTETEFAPDQVVTRGQLIDFLNRYAKYVGSELVLEVEGNPDETLTWAMAEEIVNDFFARLYAELETVA